MDGRHLAADRWREDYRIAGVEALELHHLYRAMAWLGGALPEPEQDARTPFASRCTKDLVEERLFAHRRDLCSRLDLVFMDTSSLYFEGTGGQTRGRHGHSKDHRPDLRQMILAVLIDDVGRPVCSECRATAQTAPWRHEELMGWTAPLPASTGHRRRWGRRVREPSTMKIATIGLDLARVCGQRAHLGRSGEHIAEDGSKAEGDEVKVTVARKLAAGKRGRGLDAGEVAGGQMKRDGPPGQVGDEMQLVWCGRRGTGRRCQIRRRNQR